MTENQVLGIDVGGSGIKGAIVDVSNGKLLTERYRLPTPQPAKPKAVADIFKAVVNHFKYDGKIGVGFPAIVKNGVAHSAANIDKKWLGTDIEKLLSGATGCPVYVRNDADVAGIAEAQHGAAKKQKGIVILLTIGTGIGSAIFNNGNLLPNSELGHLKFKESIAEHYTADSVRKREDLSWDEWGKRFNEYLQHLDRIFSPNLIVLGGGTSKKFDKFKAHIEVEAKVVPAKLLNHAGIIGAASLVAIQAQKTLARSKE
ncbi:MAG: ROK family protein [Bacteroidota bacterium]